MQAPDSKEKSENHPSSTNCGTWVSSSELWPFWQGSRLTLKLRITLPGEPGTGSVCQLRVGSATAQPWYGGPSEPTPKVLRQRSMEAATRTGLFFNHCPLSRVIRFASNPSLAFGTRSGFFRKASKDRDLARASQFQAPPWAQEPPKQRGNGQSSNELRS